LILSAPNIPKDYKKFASAGKEIESRLLLLRPGILDEMEELDIQNPALKLQITTINTSTKKTAQGVTDRVKNILGWKGK